MSNGKTLARFTLQGKYFIYIIVPFAYDPNPNLRKVLALFGNISSTWFPEESLQL
jgi:hypothetical protein